jgi:hypothetical protein
MKKITLKRTALLIAMAISIPAIAQTYVMRSTVTDKITIHRDDDIQVGAWADSGGHIDCSAWTPIASSVTYGQQFLQSRTCSQIQSQETVTRRFNVQTEAFDAPVTTIENRTLAVEETQSATGAYQNWQPAESTFTAWADSATPYTYGSWVPGIETMNENFSQSRTYSKIQERYEQARELDSITSSYRNNGSPILRTQTIPNLSESRNVAVTAAQYQNTAIADATAWLPVSDAQTANYTQSRNYTQVKERALTFTAGGSEVIGSRIESTADTGLSESRNVTVSLSTWINSGVRYNCSTWSPDSSLYPSSSQVPQTRQCSQEQSRTTTHTASGVTVFSKPDTQTISVTENQTTSGTKAVCAYYNSNINYGGIRQDAGYDPSWYVMETTGNINVFYGDSSNQLSLSEPMPYTLRGKRYTRGALIFTHPVIGYKYYELCVI